MYGACHFEIVIYFLLYSQWARCVHMEASKLHVIWISILFFSSVWLNNQMFSLLVATVDAPSPLSVPKKNGYQANLLTLQSWSCSKTLFRPTELYLNSSRDSKYVRLKFGERWTWSLTVYSFHILIWNISDTVNLCGEKFSYHSKKM